MKKDSGTDNETGRRHLDLELNVYGCYVISLFLNFDHCMVGLSINSTRVVVGIYGVITAKQPSKYVSIMLSTFTVVEVVMMAMMPDVRGLTG